MNEMKEKALQRAMQLCSRSEKSAKDIREKLKQWNVAEDLHESIIEELCEENFLDVLRYARSYVHDKIYLSKWGKQKVYFALKMKEIPEGVVEEALGEIEEARYEEGLRKLLESKKKNIKDSAGYEKIAKLIRFGQSRGFTITEINKALNNII